jgi:hypothetical protein
MSQFTYKESAMTNPAVDGTGNITGNMTMFATTHPTIAPFIAPPVVDLQEPSTTVDLYRVAYHRDNTGYDDLLAALLNKVASMQAYLTTRA